MEVLSDKQKDRNIASIPVIMIASKMDKRHIARMAASNVKKILSKPIRIDVLFKSISDLTGIVIKLDTTPGILEVHFNEDILFVEAAQGFNGEKIELLRYKLKELLNLYDSQNPKVLVMISNIDVKEDTGKKLLRLFSIITENAQPNLKLIQVLTGTEEIRKIIKASPDFASLRIVDIYLRLWISSRYLTGLLCPRGYSSGEAA